MAGAPFGFGMIVIFLAVTTYLIDAYTIFAASVLAANSVLRSLFGFAFPLFTQYMYKNLGIHWASSIPAFLALACLPAPFLLYKYGEAIRARCPYAAESERVMRNMRMRSEEEYEDAATSSAVTSASKGEVPAEKEPVKEMAKIKRSTTTASKISVSMSAAVGYESSPYDIDRVYTKESLSGLASSVTPRKKL